MTWLWQAALYWCGFSVVLAIGIARVLKQPENVEETLGPAGTIGGGTVELEVEMRLGYPSGGGSPDPRTVTITITDRASRTVMLEVDLTPVQFRDLMSGSSVYPYPTAFVGNLDHVGKRMEHITCSVPSQTGDFRPDGGTPVHVQEAAERFRQHQETPEEWVPDTPRRTNEGKWQLVLRRWVA